ncbi:MAG: hypothetical protein ACXVKA_01915 [Acidimicrobiia bacterium]
MSGATLDGVGMTHYRVGQATLVRVPYADVLVDADVVGLTQDQVEANRWAAPTWAEGSQVRVGAAVWIIESERRRIVVDPAQAADEILRNGPDGELHQQAVADLLEAAGYPRESIDAVVASHIDGIGMIAWRTGDEWTPFFPNAELFVSRRESNAISDDGPYRPSGAQAFTALQAQGAVTTVDDEHVVTSEVTTAWTGAHSPGHQLVHIVSDGEAATMLGHLALSPLHCAIGDCGPHFDPVAANDALRGLADGRVLVGPLWPTPGAVRWAGDRIETVVPEAQ